MQRLHLPLAVLLLLTPLFAFQERVKAKQAEDFPSLVTSIQKAWDAGDYGKCIKALKDGLGLATEKRIEAILAALPKVQKPNWTTQPQQTKNAYGKGTVAAGMAATVGSFIEEKAMGPDGATMTTKVNADSPLISMISMQFKNPALLGPDVELIKYGAHSALLTNKQNGNLELKILIHDLHVTDVMTRGMSEDELFETWNQRAVDQLAAALGR